MNTVSMKKRETSTTGNVVSEPVRIADTEISPSALQARSR
jgi:hypothetical protein